MPFAPGESGNPGGKPKRAKLTFDALNIELKSRADANDKKGMRLIAEKVVDLAEAGERWAVEFIRDTMDGKPAQEHEHSGSIDTDVTHHGEVAISGTAAFIAEALGAGAAGAPEEPGQD